MIHWKIKNQKGATALVLVVIIGAAGLFMARNTSFLVIDDLRIRSLHDANNQALALAEGCAEEVLRRVRLDDDFSASGTVLEYGDGKCEINLEKDGDSRSLIAITTVAGSRKKIQVDFIVEDGGIALESWREIE